MKLSELKNKFKNKYAIRIVAGVLVVTLLGAGVPIYNVSAAKGNGAAETAVEEQTEDEASLKAVLDGSLKVNEKEIGKEETVYILADSTGKADEVIVSDHLINNEDKDIIEDVSKLTDIKNVKGDETFTKDGDKLVWQTGGNDIYYQGTGKKQTPVTQKLTYFLDGKEIAPEKLAGRSGKVTIRFDYTNNEKREAAINGKKEEICVPFVALSGMVLDESFQNIEVTNGRIVADGNRNVVFGYALPGLKESLKLEEKDFDEEISIPDYFEVTADVENFALDMTMTAVMNATNFVSAEESEGKDSVDELLDELTDATSQLEEGSAALADGVDTLKNNMGDFQSGVAALKDGIQAYTSGAGTLNEGIGTLKGGVDTLADHVPALVDGVGQLKGGADSAATGAVSLKDGAAGVATGAVSLKDGAAGVATGAVSLKDGAAGVATGAVSLKDGAAGVADGVGQVKDGVTTLAGGAAQVSAGVDAVVGTIQGMGTTLEASKNGVYEKFQADTGMTLEQAEATVQSLQQAQATLIQGMICDVQAAQYLAAGGANTDDAYQQLAGGAQQCYGGVAAALGGTITNVNEAAAALGTINGQLAALQNGMGMADGAVGAINNVQAALGAGDSMTQLAALKDGASQVAAGAEALAQKMPELYDGASKVATGAAALSDGASKVATGAESLSSGASKVATGAESLSNGASQVAAGATTLSDGVGALNAGITQLNDKTGVLGNGVGELKSGVAKLAEGSGELVSNSGALNDGVNQLSDGTTQIADGVGQLSDGAHELADGVVTFNEEGIEKIVNSYNGDLQPLMERLQAVLSAGEEYQSYTGIADGVNGSVKFVYKTAAIKAE